MSYADQEIKSKSKFLKIEAGEPHDIRLLDESPVENMKHSTGKMVILCKGEDLCEMCQDGDQPSQKFCANVYEHALKRVMLWEYGVGVAKLLKAIAITLQEENKSIMDVDLKVEATGSMLQKRYSVTPRLTARAVPEGLKKLSIEGDLAFDGTR